jgi:hypothetical protein
MNRKDVLTRALQIGYKTLNITYMDWNQVDWHLKKAGYGKIKEVLCTMSAVYGILVWEDIEWSYFIDKDGNVKIHTVKMLKGAV